MEQLKEIADPYSKKYYICGFLARDDIFNKYKKNLKEILKECKCEIPEDLMFSPSLTNNNSSHSNINISLQKKDGLWNSNFISISFELRHYPGNCAMVIANGLNTYINHRINITMTRWFRDKLDRKLYKLGELMIEDCAKIMNKSAIDYVTASHQRKIQRVFEENEWVIAGPQFINRNSHNKITVYRKIIYNPEEKDYYSYGIDLNFLDRVL